MRQACHKAVGKWTYIMQMAFKAWLWIIQVLHTTVLLCECQEQLVQTPSVVKSPCPDLKEKSEPYDSPL